MGGGGSTYMFPSTWTISSVSATVWPEIVAVAWDILEGFEEEKWLRMLSI